MKLNLLGRVRNTRLSSCQCVVTLFEAVINSIHAIELGPVGLGEISVVIERAKTQQMKIDGTGAVDPISSFQITDNGSGFIDGNYESFCTSDSQHKLTRGGKGVGRFLWLKAFDHAEIDSNYQTPDGSVLNRRFELRLTEDGVHNPSNTQIPAGQPVKRGTTVRL